MKHNRLTLSFIACVLLIGLHAQSPISIVPQLELRMLNALNVAEATGQPAWCDNSQLQGIRKTIIEKCIRTLYHNHLGAEGGVLHEGIMPSPEVFNGLWAWDSWKHAYALAGFDKDLAENSVRAMFDYQDSTGMIADCIFIDKKENNYRDTKPPLSAWAVYRIFEKTGDTLFLAELYPRLLRYHYWWYSFRDHDQNGLCEYGSVDGTLQASRWESGWDNAIRFDSAKILKNHPGAYSMNVESVDLNSYLHLEKENLIKMAIVFHDSIVAQKLKREREVLGIQIRNLFFEPVSGFFYDIRLEDKSFIWSKEASGWLPLYAGIADKEQALRVRNEMMTEGSFNTKVPLPTASRDNHSFNPQLGYWRGPVWIDQFYYGYMGLKRYGYHEEAKMLLMKLLENGEGIIHPLMNLRENYDPLTGKGLNAEYFAWTAAHLLLMMTED